MPSIIYTQSPTHIHQPANEIEERTFFVDDDDGDGDDDDCDAASVCDGIYHFCSLSRAQLHTHTHRSPLENALSNKKNEMMSHYAGTASHSNAHAPDMLTKKFSGNGSNGSTHCCLFLFQSL